MGETRPDDEPGEGEGWTEAYDGEVERSDMVGKAANGTAFLLLKSAQNAAAGGMFSAEAMADLVAKAELSTASVNDLPDSAFAYIEPGGEKDEQGKTTPRSKRHFPVHDAAHTRNALARASQSPFGDKAMPKIRAAAAKFGVQVSDDVAKAGASAPGSPAWEAQDAAKAQQAIDQLGSLRGLVRQLVAREGAEVGAGHLDDLDDALDLRCIDDALRLALQQLTAFAAGEQAAAAVAKAGAKGGADAVHDTITKLAGACGCPVCAGWIAGAKQQGDRAEAAQPPQDANDGPAADQQAPRPAAPKPTPAGPPAVATPEQTMQKTAETETTAQTAAAGAGTDALTKAQRKISKEKAKRAAVEAELAKATAKSEAQEGQLAELAKRLERLESQPAQGSGPAFNGAAFGATPQPAAGITGGAPTDERAALTKAIAEEHDPVRKAELQERFVVAGLKDVFAAGPTVAPAPRPQG